VVEACKEHLPGIAKKLDNPRVEICIQDAVKYIEGTSQQKNNLFDVILIDSTDPIGAGEGLFTVDFYKNVYNSLQSNGIMANQSESPWADPVMFQGIYHKLCQVFPAAHPYMATVPSYPGGIWSWTFCSKGLQPEILRSEIAIEIEKQSRYFNRDLYKASFVLPNYVKKLLSTDKREISSC
ncbi:MAG: spermidine synthase, partial [Waddliaceae bacterium]